MKKLSYLLIILVQFNFANINSMEDNFFPGTSFKFNDLSDSVSVWKNEMDSSFMAQSLPILIALFLKNDSREKLLNAGICGDSVYKDYFQGRDQPHVPDSLFSEDGILEQVVEPVIENYHSWTSWGNAYISKSFNKYLRASLCALDDTALARAIVSVKNTVDNAMPLLENISRYLYTRRYTKVNSELFNLYIEKQNGRLVWAEDRLDSMYSPEKSINNVYSIFASRINDQIQSEYIEFWIGRNQDSTDALFEAIFVKIGLIINPTLISMLEQNKDLQVIPVFFDTASFKSTILNEHPILDCHNRLVARYFDKVLSSRLGDSIPIRDTSFGMVLNSFGSYFFNSALSYYSLLLSQNDSAHWEKIRLDPHITFYTDSNQGCEGDLRYRLTVYTRKPTEVPLLFAGLPANNIPKGFYLLKADSVEPAGYSGGNVYDRITEYTIPQNGKTIKKIFKVDHSWQIVNGSPWKNEVLLCVIMDSGDTIELWKSDIQQSYTGIPSRLNYEIDNCFLTDANGDNRSDLVVGLSSGDRLLFLQLEYSGFEMRRLRSEGYVSCQRKN